MQTRRFQTGSIVAIALMLFGFSLVNAEWGEVSMVALIASPEKYDGKIVGTVGFVVIRKYPLATALYLSRDEAEHDVATNAIALMLDHSQVTNFRNLNGQRVYVRGRYRKGQENDGAIPNGEIAQITAFDAGFWPHTDLPPLK